MTIRYSLRSELTAHQMLHNLTWLYNVYRIAIIPVHNTIKLMYFGETRPWRIPCDVSRCGVIHVNFPRDMKRGLSTHRHTSPSLSGDGPVKVYYWVHKYLTTLNLFFI